MSGSLAFALDVEMWCFLAILYVLATAHLAITSEPNREENDAQKCR